MLLAVEIVRGIRRSSNEVREIDSIVADGCRWSWIAETCEYKYKTTVLVNQNAEHSFRCIQIDANASVETLLNRVAVKCAEKIKEYKRS